MLHIILKCKQCEMLYHQYIVCRHDSLQAIDNFLRSERKRFPVPHMTGDKRQQPSTSGKATHSSERLEKGTSKWCSGISDSLFFFTDLNKPLIGTRQCSDSICHCHFPIRHVWHRSTICHSRQLTGVSDEHQKLLHKYRYEYDGIQAKIRALLAQERIEFFSIRDRSGMFSKTNEMKLQGTDGERMKIQVYSVKCYFG